MKSILAACHFFFIYNIDVIIYRDLRNYELPECRLSIVLSSTDGLVDTNIFFFDFKLS